MRLSGLAKTGRIITLKIEGVYVRGQIVRIGSKYYLRAMRENGNYYILGVLIKNSKKQRKIRLCNDLEHFIVEVDEDDISSVTP